ncbi:MAG TPA: heme-binding beta-barrel domain-containing protein [Steroidobacteraceae bacterium]|nr:heme-binding beta-barrel domain-containing protein [Steroidobacteraceae bacterium]
MIPFPEDIYTEQEADPDTLANLGPLRRLAGTWESSAGVDINPKADGPQRREYREHIELEPLDAQSNGPQLFYGLRYHTHINAPGEDATFHDQNGYWLWEPATGLVLQTLSIPRGQVAIAAGHTTPDATEMVLTAQRGQTEYGICSTTFLEYAFRTDSYRIEVVFNPDGSWSYVLDTILQVRGRVEPFLHRDRNTLVKVAEPKPNPLALLRARAARG